MNIDVGRRRLLAGMSVLALLASAQSAHAAPSNPSPVAPSVSGETAALTAARANGHDVEVVSARTETATVFATPKGTMRLEQSLRPIRTKVGASQWATTDATLKRNSDGTLSPIAATVPMTFSGGGTGPMATIGATGQKTSLGWLSSLPVPVVSGDTAIYPEVLRGVDLKITAEVDGFRHVLVVKTREAAANPALVEINYPITTDLSLGDGDASGVVVAKDAKGSEVLRGTASMWDTPRSRVRTDAMRDGDSAELREALTRTVGLKVGKQRLTVIPDRAMLTSMETGFPLSIDPGWQSTVAGRNSWMAIFDRQGGPLYNQPIYADDNGYKGEVKIGRTPSAADNNFVARAMFNFNTSAVAFKHVNRAYLSIKQLWSSSWCGDSGTRRTHLQSVNPYNTNTTWYNQPAWYDIYGYSDALKFYNSSGCPAGPVEFNATGYLQAAANYGWGSVNMGLKASNEGDTSSWKRYQLSSAAMVVEYNSYPNAPDSLAVEGQNCIAGQTLYVNNPAPELRARVTDVDAGSSLTGYVDYTNLSTGAAGYVWQDALPNGGTVVKRMPSGLPDGTYQIRSHSQDGIDWSQWSGTCDFVLDTTKPPTPGAVSADIYPSDPQLHNGVGRAGNFTFNPPDISADVYAYKYALTPNTVVENATYVPADPVTKKVTVPIVPTVDGALELRVWTVDRVGNVSATFLPYKFNATVGSGPAARWTFDSTTAPLNDVTGHNNSVTMQGDAALAGARGGLGKSLGVSGNLSSNAVTGGQLQGRHPDTNVVAPFRTDKSFSVAAWVKLDRVGQYQTVASVEGSRISAFFLRMIPGPDRWAFTLAPNDIDNSAYVQAVSAAAPVAGRWTHLSGVYDATAKQARLYVNGQLAGTVAVPMTLSTTGPVVIGRAKWNGGLVDWLKGGIDDVQIWDRIVTEPEFRVMAAPLRPAVALSATSVTPGTSVQATFNAVGDVNVAKYLYQVDGGAVQTATPAAPGDPATVNVGALAIGAHKVVVYSVDLTGNQGPINRADFKVRAAPKISGTIYDSTTGAPAPGATVTVYPGGYTATTAANGSYTITGMTSGHYTVSATIGGRRCGLFAGTETDIPEPVLMDLILQPQADAFGYTCTEEVRTFVEGDDTPATRVDITGDDMSTPLALPFAFPFYGQSYSTVYLSTNGVVSFAPIDVDDSLNNPVPSAAKPNAAIYPYWTDLQMTPYPNSSLLTKLITDGGEQAFIIHFHGMRTYGSGPRISFAVILYQSGKIVINYTKIDPASEIERGNSASVGIENGDGSTGFLYSYNEPVLADNHAIVFNPPLS